MFCDSLGGGAELPGSEGRVRIIFLRLREEHKGKCGWIARAGRWRIGWVDTRSGLACSWGAREYSICFATLLELVRCGRLHPHRHTRAHRHVPISVLLAQLNLSVSRAQPAQTTHTHAHTHASLFPFPCAHSTTGPCKTALT